MSSKGATRSTRGASSSRAGGSKRSRSTSSHRLPWSMTEAMKVKFPILSNRRVICTKYIDVESLEHVGLSERVHQYLRNVHWEQFASYSPPTYLELTYEFLSSLECKLFRGSPKEVGTVKFRLCGTDYHFKMKEINRLFGFSKRGKERAMLGLNLSDMWYALTGNSTYQPGQSKSTKLRDPALRYIHKFMTQSIFGRGLSGGACTRAELYILHAMVTKEKISTAFWMFDHFQRVANQTKGDICIGGIITMLANLLGHDLDAYQMTRVEGKSAIDLELMYFMGMVRKDWEGNYTLETEAGPCGQDKENDNAGSSPDESDDDVSAQPDHPMRAQPVMQTYPPHMAECSHASQFDEMKDLITTGFTRLQVDQFRIYRKLNKRCDAIQQQINQLASRQKGAENEDEEDEMEEDEEEEAEDEEEDEDDDNVED